VPYRRRHYRGMLIDLLLQLVDWASQLAYSLGHPIPCWDLVAEAHGICR
jgi:hypothetical protein